MCKLQIDSCIFRSIIFAVACIMSLGTYFSYHVPSVLQKQFEGPINRSCNDDIELSATTNETSLCCTDCLGMTSLQYNYLFAGYSWTNALTVILCGFIIDKFGNGVSGVFFSLIVIIGASLFACGSLPHVRGTIMSFPLLVTGRILQGAATGGVRVVQDRTVAFWFKNDMSVAFGFLVAVARATNVINFLVTDMIAEAYGLSFTLWMSTGICGCGFISAILLLRLDDYGLKRQRLQRKTSTRVENTSLNDIKRFPLLFWFIVLCMVFFFSATVPFFADASKFIQDKFHYSSVNASYISGIVFDICVVFAPILGFILDYIGHRGWCMLVMSAICLPVFPVLAFTHLHPAVLFTALGVALSMASVSTWSSIAIIIHMRNLGMAFGVTTCAINIGVGVTNWAVGEFLGQNQNLSETARLTHWKFVLLLGFINVIITFIFSIIINVQDTRLGTIINAKGRKTAHEGGLVNSASGEVTYPEVCNEASHLLGGAPPTLPIDATPRKLSLSYSAVV